MKPCWYVHFGDAEHHPMQTVSYATREEAQSAADQAIAEGWPARIHPMPEEKP